MKTYLILFKEKQNNVLTKDLYFAHIGHLEQIDQNGTLFIAGPLVEKGQLMQIIRADSQSDAERIAESDPYFIHGYYQAYECCEWIEAKRDNNWLMDTPRIVEMLKTLR